VRARWHLSCCEYLGVGRSACIAPRTAHTSLPCERPGKTPRGRVVHRCGRFGYPLMLKARKLSYDGKGNAVVRSDAEMQVSLSVRSSTHGEFRGCGVRAAGRRRAVCNMPHTA
jgi:hypothetical protein